jgi:hypothetical protein
MSIIVGESGSILRTISISVVNEVQIVGIFAKILYKNQENIF